MNAGASVPTVAVLLATLCGLVAFVVVVVGLARALDSRPARAPGPPPEPGVRPVPDPPSPEPAGAAFFTAANVWFAIGLTLLIGGWDTGGNGYTLFGYGRIEESVYWWATAMVFVAAGYSLRRWMRAGTDPAAPDEGRPPAPYFAFAQMWFVVGLLLLLGMQHRSESSYRLFGEGRIVKPVYWGVLGGVFGAAGFNLLRWRRTGTPSGPTAVQDLARIGLAGIVLLGLAGGLALAKDKDKDDFLYVGGAAVLVYTVVTANLVRLAFGRPAGTRANRPQAMRVAAPAAGLVMLITSGIGLAMVMVAGALFGMAGPWSAWVVCLVGLGLLGAVVLLVGLAVRPAGPSPRGRRLVAGAVPVGLVLLAVAGGLWAVANEAGPYTEAHRRPKGQAVLWGVGAAVVLAAAVGRRLSRWAYPEWWAHRERLLYPDAAPPPTPVPPVPTPAPGRDCPTCGQSVPPGSPQGLCPRCLLKGVMPSASRPSPTLAFVEAFVAPPVEDVAKLFPHLEVTELIGQGGMGAVYLARQTALDRPVALKLIRPREADPTFAERFAREARALAKLTHANVVTVHESGAAGGLPYLVMEYVDGVTLRDTMREKKLEPAAALAVVRQLCDALEYAHAQGVVHRDVKPENILLTRDGRVKIADFGLAKVADPAGVSLTGTQQAMGTPHYMAPEQWERPAAVDHRADIYALGVVLYELLTGELPLGRFDPPSQKVRLDIRLDEVVLRALAKEPDRRYQHASQVKTDLDRIGAPAAAGGWVRGRTFREYRSKTIFLGWPLVHVALGFDPETGRRKTAVGWVAVGDAGAVGGLALAGGWALGGLAVGGGGAVGLVTLAGGMALGGVALAGGWATGAVLAAAGGMALAGGLAVAGGYALAPFAIGSAADGGYVLSAARRSPDFLDQLRHWTGWLADTLWPF